MKKTNKIWKISIDDETLRDIKGLIMFCGKNFPFLPVKLWNLYKEFDEILLNGCFKHNIFTEEFRTIPNSTIRICPECSPE